MSVHAVFEYLLGFFAGRYKKATLKNLVVIQIAICNSKEEFD